MNRIRTGIIGFGLAGRVFHAPFIRAVPDLVLTAIVERTGDAASAVYPEVRVVRSAEDLFQSDVDLVVIATPNATHVPLARAALHAGKHVVIDKPFAPTSSEALELERLAAASGLLLAPFHNRRFDGDFLTLEALLESGQTGRTVKLMSRFDRFRPVPRANTWKETGDDANGLLMDLGPHLLDQALVLFGQPETITASVRADRDSSAIEDAFDIVLTFSREGQTFRAELGATMLAADPQPRFLLHGTRGSYRKRGVDPQEPGIVAGARVPALDSNVDWLTEADDAWGTLTTAADPQKPTILNRRVLPTLRGDYRSFYSGIARALLQGTAPPTTPRDGVRVARLMELARESSRTAATLSIRATRLVITLASLRQPLPLGFRWASAKAGIKSSGRPDLAIAVCDTSATAAVLFTRNQVVAAPVIVGREHMATTGGGVRAVMVNAGNANCATRHRRAAHRT